MGDPFLELLHEDPSRAVLGVVMSFFFYLLFGMLPVGVMSYAIYFFVTLPLRRNERARLLLDLVEQGLRDGRSPEATLVEVSSSRDRGLGARFHLLAAHLEQGQRLSQALREVPYLLPPQVRAMLGAGERIGDMQKVLPAARLLLRDSVSYVRGALNYVILLAFALTPAILAIPLILRVYVMPRFLEVFIYMAEGIQLPAFTRLVLGGGDILVGIEVALLCVLWVAALAYLGGPRLYQPGLHDGLMLVLPWRRKRLQRDFSAMLAVLLDANVPEAEAVTLAAEATANRVFVRRGKKVRTRLESGMKLADALRALDPSRELQWRLANALERGSGFARALSGWYEVLDARAFQQEQAAAQVTTTMLVLLNGLVVASILIAIFLLLISLINASSIW